MDKEISLQDIFNEIKNTKTELKSEITNVTKAIAKTNIKLDKLTQSVNDHENRLHKLEELAIETETYNFDVNKITTDFAIKLEEKDRIINTLLADVNQLSLDSRRNNLTISGLQEKPGEDRNILASNLKVCLSELIGFNGNIKPFQVYRRGSTPSTPNAPRKIVLKLPDLSIKNEILHNAYKLKGCHIYISHDFTPRQDTARFYLRKFIREKGSDKAKFITNFIVQFETKKYYYNESTERVEIKE